jgi:RNA polymerase-binding protein DksA
MVKPRQREELRQALVTRSQALREEIRQELLDMGEEHFVDLAGQVRDLEDSSVADMLVDLDMTMLDMHVDELRDIEAALLRMKKGEYGLCVDCGEETAVERLRAYPTAKRCQPCQTRRESRYAGRSRASI